MVQVIRILIELIIAVKALKISFRAGGFPLFF